MKCLLYLTHLKKIQKWCVYILTLQQRNAKLLLPINMSHHILAYKRCESCGQKFSYCNDKVGERVSQYKCPLDNHFGPFYHFTGAFNFVLAKYTCFSCVLNIFIILNNRWRNIRSFKRTEGESKKNEATGQSHWRSSYENRH